MKQWLIDNLHRVLEVKMMWSNGSQLGIQPLKPYPVRRKVVITEASRDADYVVIRFFGGKQSVAAELHYTDAQRVIDAEGTTDFGIVEPELEGDGTIVE